MNLTTNSRHVFVTLEVFVDWSENEHGTKEFIQATCETSAPFNVKTWAETVAWQKVNGVQS